MLVGRVTSAVCQGVLDFVAPKQVLSKLRDHSFVSGNFHSKHSIGLLRMPAELRFLRQPINRVARKKYVKRKKIWLKM